MHQFHLPKLTPRQARRFAQAIGKLAKTDRVDAGMGAGMGAVLDLSPQTPATSELHDMRELRAARRALIKDQTAARTRLATASAGSVKTILWRRLRQITKDIDRIDATLRNLSHLDATCARKVAILASIPGIGQLAAITLLIDVPEIGKHGQQAGRQLGWTGPSLAKFREMAGRRKDPRWSGAVAQSSVHASARSHTREPGHDKKVQSAHQCRKREKGRADRHHAEVARHGKCLTTR